MKRHFLAVMIVTLCGACGERQPERQGSLKELSVDASFARGVYYLEGELVIRQKCPQSAVFLNRVTCDSGVEKLYYWFVQDYLAARYGNRISAFESAAQQNLQRIDHIDGQILMLLASEPTSSDHLLGEMKILEEEVEAFSLVMNQLLTQHQSVSAQTRSDDSPDLRRLLKDLENRLAEVSAKRDASQEKLESVRREYYRVNSAILSQDTFKRLTGHREEAVRSYGKAKSDLKREIGVRLELHTAIRFLEDPSNLWEFRENDAGGGAKPAVSVGRAFDSYYPRIGLGMPYTGDWDEDKKIFIVPVPVPGLDHREISITMAQRLQNRNICRKVRIRNNLIDVEVDLPPNGLSIKKQSNPSVYGAFFVPGESGGKTFVQPVCSDSFVPADFYVSISVHTP